MKQECVVLAHPRQAMLRSLKGLLEPEFEVAAMADNALSLVDAVASLEPDLAVVDVSIRSRSDANLVRHLKDRYPALRLIVLGDEGDEIVVKEVLNWGASGYVLKQAADTDLILAARAVARGENYVSPECDVDVPHDSAQTGKKG
jgi:DNA-binding NarL/FixJ family response regulator